MDSSAPKHSINWHSWVATAIGVGTVLVGLVVLGMKIGDLIGLVNRLNTDVSELKASQARMEETVNRSDLGRTADRKDTAHNTDDITAIWRRLELVEQRKR